VVFLDDFLHHLLDPWEFFDIAVDIFGSVLFRKLFVLIDRSSDEFQHSFRGSVFALFVEQRDNAKKSHAVFNFAVLIGETVDIIPDNLFEKIHGVSLGDRFVTQ